jgi:hypothetical protein
MPVATLVQVPDRSTWRAGLKVTMGNEKTPDPCSSENACTGEELLETLDFMS